MEFNNLIEKLRFGLFKKANIPVVLWIIFIWGQSCMPPTVSEGESGAVFKFLQSLFPFLTHYLVRKLAHFTEYMILGGIVRFSHTAIHSAVFCEFIAFFDETIQIFSGRGAAVADIWIDFMGALLGVAVITAVKFIFRKKAGKVE